MFKSMMKKEGGFTLVELMVVILIIAILMAVAVPVFISARDRAVIRAAQSRLKEVVNAAKELHGGGNSTTVTGAESGIAYNAISSSDLNAELDTITVGSGAPTGEGVQITSNTPVGGVSFTTLDANNTSHTASITQAGNVTIN